MTSTWRLARSLATLRAEVQQDYPGTSVWTIGDAAHRSGPSDHNPNSAGVVCAADFRGNRGLDLEAFAEHLKRTNHKAIKYVIFNRRIWSKARNSEGWRPYHGSNPHTTHVHVSVGVGSDGQSTGPYDIRTPWGVSELSSGSMPRPTPPAAPQPVPPTTDWTQELIMALPTLKRGAKGDHVASLQGLLHARGYTGSRIDAIFGPKTEKDVKRFQERNKVRNSVKNGVGDGITGRYTWAALLRQ